MSIIITNNKTKINKHDYSTVVVIVSSDRESPFEDETEEVLINQEIEPEIPIEDEEDGEELFGDNYEK